MNLGEAVMEEDAEEAGRDLDVLASPGLHGGAHDALQLRARRRVEVQRQTTVSVSHQLKMRRHCTDGGGQQQANGQHGTTHPSRRHLVFYHCTRLGCYSKSVPSSRRAAPFL